VRIKHGKQTRRQRGDFIILAPIFITVLLSLTALVLDASRLYFSQLRLQRAIDNALVEAPALLFMGKNVDQISGRTIEQVREAIVKSINANLAANGLNPQRATLTTLDVRDDFVGIEGFYNSPLWLSNKIFKLATLSKVKGAAAARIPRINLVLAIDRSRSMFEDSGVGDGMSRVAKVIQAVTMGVPFLRPRFDRVSIVTFEDNSDVRMAFRQQGGFDQTEIETLVDGLTSIPECPDSAVECAGWSNLQDGLETAALQFESLPDRSNDVNLIVYMSDSRVTHARFRIHPGSIQGLAPNNPEGRAFYDYFTFPYRMECRARGANNGCIDAYINGYTLFPAPLADADLQPACETTKGDMSTCLNSIGILGPEGDPIRPFLPLTARNVRQQAYLATIAEADSARKRGIMTFALAFGPDGIFQLFDEIPDRGAPHDVAQLFLRRVSLDPEQESLGDPDFPGISTAAAERAGTQGKYWGAYFRIANNVSVINAYKAVLGKIGARIIR